MNTLRVLLVEDNLADAELLSVWLEDLGAPLLIEHVERFTEARERWQQGHYDALLDLDIPDGFGLELLHKALSLVGSRPVVILTGNIDPLVKALALETGAAAYVLKGREHVPTLLAAVLGLQPGMEAD